MEKLCKSGVFFLSMILFACNTATINQIGKLNSKPLNDCYHFVFIDSKGSIRQERKDALRGMERCEEIHSVFESEDAMLFGTDGCVFSSIGSWNAQENCFGYQDFAGARKIVMLDNEIYSFGYHSVDKITIDGYRKIWEMHSDIEIASMGKKDSIFYLFSTDSISNKSELFIVDSGKTIDRLPINIRTPNLVQNLGEDKFVLADSKGRYFAGRMTDEMIWVKVFDKIPVGKLGGLVLMDTETGNLVGPNDYDKNQLVDDPIIWMDYEKQIFVSRSGILKWYDVANKESLFHIDFKEFKTAIDGIPTKEPARGVCVLEDDRVLVASRLGEIAIVDIKNNILVKQTTVRPSQWNEQRLAQRKGYQGSNYRYSALLCREKESMLVGSRIDSFLGGV